MTAGKTRVRIKTPSADVVAERQRLEDERARVFSASSIRYSIRTDKVTMQMRSGIEHIIPRHLIDELVHVPAATLAKELTLGIGGDVISVPSYDIDIAVAGLLRDLDGFNIQRLGGRSRTGAKVAAARENGRKGGRPRRRAAAK
jgi:hypothetical protein